MRQGRGRSCLRCRTPLVAVALVALVAACFLPSLGNDFVWDDAQYILGNPPVRAGLSLHGALWALTARYAANWHPLTWLSHMTDVSLFGLAPGGHRLVNVALHATNAVLLLLLLLRATGRLWSGALVAALFAAHPLRVESVVWVAERKDVLSSCLGLAALLVYLRWVGRPRPALLASVAGLHALGLMAKPMLVTLPVLLLVLDWWPLGRLDRRRWRERVLEKTPLWVLSALSAGITLAAQGAGGAIHLRPPGESLANALVSCAAYLRMTVLPRGLSSFYRYPPGGPGVLPAAVSLLALAAIAVVAARTRRSRPWVLAGGLWYLASVLPVLGIVPFGEQALADRYTYLPLVGPVLAVVWTLSAWAAGRRGRSLWLTAAACAGVAILGGLTLRQEGFWRDNLSLYLRWRQVSPPSAFIEYNLGVAYQGLGDLARAEHGYRAALALEPGKVEALVNLGTVLSSQGRRPEAAALFRQALRQQPASPTAWNNLGSIELEENRPREAREDFRRAVSLDPSYVDARLNLGRVLAAAGVEDEACEQFAAAARLAPESPLARYQYGVALARAGRYAEALGELRAAVDLAPGDRQARAAARDAEALLRGGGPTPEGGTP